jgi:hypothetical protein
MGGTANEERKDKNDRKNGGKIPKIQHMPSGFKIEIGY